MRPLMTPAEAAKHLRISVRTLAAHIANGELPRVILGGGAKRKRWAIDPADLEAFIEHRKVRIVAPAAAPVRLPSKLQIYDFAKTRKEMTPEKLKAIRDQNRKGRR